MLCYHAVSERWESPLAVRPAAFAEQLEDLLARGYRGATFSEALARSAPGKILVVTFDDAYCSVLSEAAPILTRLGVPATVFVPTDFPGAARRLTWPGIDHWLGSEHEHELTPLTWEQLGELADRGWEIGSHTCSHPRLTRLDAEDLARELRDSRAACAAHLARPCPSIAYPYGDVDRRVVTAACRAGYRFGAGLPEQRHGRQRLAWPRVGVYRDDDLPRFRRQVSRLIRGVRAVAPEAVVLGARIRRAVQRAGLRVAPDDTPGR